MGLRHLDAAVERIDAKFGEDYAKQNPMLTGAFMQTVAMDFHTSATRVSTQRIGMVLEEVIGSNLNNIEESMCRAIAEAG